VLRPNIRSDQPSRQQRDAQAGQDRVAQRLWIVGPQRSCHGHFEQLLPRSVQATVVPPQVVGANRRQGWSRSALGTAVPIGRRDRELAATSVESMSAPIRTATSVPVSMRSRVASVSVASGRISRRYAPGRAGARSRAASLPSGDAPSRHHVAAERPVGDSEFSELRMEERKPAKYMMPQDRQAGFPALH